MMLFWDTGLLSDRVPYHSIRTGITLERLMFNIKKKVLYTRRQGVSGKALFMGHLLLQGFRIYRAGVIDCVALVFQSQCSGKKLAL
jgi:hypothetical protein